MFATVTVAPGIRAPDASPTVPSREAVVVCAGQEGETSSRVRARKRRQLRTENLKNLGTGIPPNDECSLVAGLASERFMFFTGSHILSSIGLKSLLLPTALLRQRIVGEPMFELQAV
jgi:hypothetical protein